MKKNKPCFALSLSGVDHPRKEKGFLSYLEENKQICKLEEFHSKPP
jgi:hypothetical protein